MNDHPESTLKKLSEEEIRRVKKFLLLLMEIDQKRLRKIKEEQDNNSR